MALRKFLIEWGIPGVGTFEREQLRGGVAKLNDVFRMNTIVKLCVVLVITTIPASVAHANYLDMSLSATNNNIVVAMNYLSGKTYKVEWKKSSQPWWQSWTRGPDLYAGNCTTTTKCYYYIGVSCNTSYRVRAKIAGRGWRTDSITTGGCGPVACPKGGWFDGANCQIGKAPDGTTAFIWGGNYYYTPLPLPNRCPYRPYPNSGFDGANCYVQAVPAGVHPFIWQNYWYYSAYP
jgi:hypothetical protein